MDIPVVGISIGAIQIIFAFLVIQKAKSLNRLNNWWVISAATLPVVAYIFLVRLSPKKENQ